MSCDDVQQLDVAATRQAFADGSLKDLRRETERVRDEIAAGAVFVHPAGGVLSAEAVAARRLIAEKPWQRAHERRRESERLARLSRWQADR